MCWHIEHDHAGTVEAELLSKVETNGGVDNSCAKALQTVDYAEVAVFRTGVNFEDEPIQVSERSHKRLNNVLRPQLPLSAR
jgi:hypothetical protein